VKYLYYPGCSLEGTAKEYDAATRALMGALDVELVELTDWTCCGATAAEGASRLLAWALPARNLALAEARHRGLDLLVPCSACYLNLKKAQMTAAADPASRRVINEVLDSVGLEIRGEVRVRHLLDVLSVDLGADAVGGRVARPLSGLKVAPYYGCQCLRPYAVFDDPEEPRSMMPFLQAVGAAVLDWDMGGRCCGASHMTTKPEAGLKLVAGILDAAGPADVIATVCPMCQMNLEAYQGRASKAAGRDLSVGVVYLPQLLGLALGLDPHAVGLHHNLSPGPVVRALVA
jgi:heterodisulfide reductase subunit B